MEAIPLCLFLNKLRLSGLTQHRFILIQIVAFTCVLHGEPKSDKSLYIYVLKNYLGLTLCSME